MSVIASIIASSASIEDNHTGRPGIRDLKALLQQIGDFDVPTNCAVRNEVQSIAIHVATVSGGNYTLTVTLRSGQTFTTANIAHDGNAAAILSAINTAATSASITGWTNGDIAVSGGPLTTTPVVLTFSGNSVKGANHALTTINGAGLTGGGSAGVISVTTAGQAERTAWALLFALGILGGTIPDQGSDPSSVTARCPRGKYPFSMGEDTIRALVREAAIADLSTTAEATLLTKLGY